MSWSWRIGRIAGIDVYVHFTFFLLLAWWGGAAYMAHREIAEAMGAIVFILTLFGIVVLHELGHALAARRYGIQTRDITLLPIGGVARLERMPDDPRQELVVAIAGPAVNVALAVVFYLLVLGAGLPLSPLDETTGLGGAFLSQLVWVNVILVVFNLLPAFPMDGGRVLRALLAMRMDYVRATQIAAAIGQAMAILFVFLGLLATNPFLMFIGLFVWLGAAQEASFVQMRSALGGIPVMRAMVTDFHTLRPGDPLSRAVDYMVAGFQQDFPVVDGDRLVGVLAHIDLGPALAQYGPNAPVGDVMRRDCAVVSPREMLESAFARLQHGDCHTWPVVENGRLVGLLTTENVTEVLMIQEALRAAKRGASRTADGLKRSDSPLKLADRP